MLKLINKIPIIISLVIGITTIILLSLNYDNLSITTLFTIGTLTISLLCAFALGGIFYYIKAKEIAPTLREKAILLEDIKSLQQTKSELKDEIKSKETELASANNTIALKDEAKQWLENNQGRIEALNISIQSETEKLAKIEEKTKERQEELNKLIQDLANKNEEYVNSANNLEEKLRSIRESEKNKIDQQLALFEAKIEEYRRNISYQKQQIEENEALIINIKKDIELKTKEFIRLKEVNQRLENTQKDYEEKIDELKKELNKLESLKEIKNDISREVNILEQKKAELATEVSSLTGTKNQIIARLAQEQERCKENTDKWASLDSKIIINTTPRNTNNPPPEYTWLAEFGNQLNNYGILFDNRIIKSFHTAIKCSEISPLAVLAGISGTGKSLLPELYSAAFGINFLPVAVQPRWDSPQDMFGFYNYMDGRYKATELSRFLWQLDGYNNKNRSFNYEPINMVLLDEMNLAKVEYYFSDLLSKLETRRGLDPNNDVLRRKAEIEIECGASVLDNRHLYISPNTLFVGTMNEDESTQTLSDKVIDRSNVIRFGRPNNLESQPDKKGLISKFQNWPVLTANIWESWKNTTRNVTSQMELLGEINEKLELVGRPFAHRVWQAMKTYISLYPCSTENYARDINNAVSDQIEMKILPKLDGLELETAGFEDVKRTINHIIDTISDDNLSNAFADACDSTKNVFFKWRGVKR